MDIDLRLKDDILAELKWEPSVNEAGIGVIVKDRVVTLTGTVRHWPEKSAAERAVQRVVGVRAVANEIQVELPGCSERTDADIGRAAANALESNVIVPHNRVKVTVENGRITLIGEVDWYYQKAAAENAVHHLWGVKEVINEIIIKPLLIPSEVKGKIEAALQRNAVLSAAKRIMVEENEGKVTLHGFVRTWEEWEEAARVAWAAPGVSFVENNIRIK